MQFSKILSAFYLSLQLTSLIIVEIYLYSYYFFDFHGMVLMEISEFLILFSN